MHATNTYEGSKHAPDAMRVSNNKQKEGRSHRMEKKEAREGQPPDMSSLFAHSSQPWAIW
jgi:hypothetical protein